MGQITIEKLSEMIDHTNLKAFTTEDQIKQLCKEAIEYNFGAVCVNPYNISIAKKYLEGSKVQICTVIGFPLGANTIKTKVEETKDAIKLGATEVDMVINVGAVKDKKWDYIKDEINALRKESEGKILKIILETCYLDDDEIKRVCEIAKECNADFVKTSTGFGTFGAKVEHVKLMRKTIGNDMGVKASGGIRSLEQALQMIDAGATRLGTSSGVKIISEFKAKNH